MAGLECVKRLLSLCVTLGTLPGLLAPQGFWGPREGRRGGRNSVGGTAGGGGGVGDSRMVAVVRNGVGRLDAIFFPL